jgi:hypothetical protein
MITVDVPVRCSGTLHRVVLKIDRLGRTRCVLEDHDQVAEKVVESLGGPPSACGAVLRASWMLQPVVPNATERAHWIRLGVRDCDSVATWREAGVHKPSAAEQWLAITERDQVAAWRGRGFTAPSDAAPWALAGFGPGGARSWVEIGKTVDEAVAWTRAGVASATGAADWGQLGIVSPEDSDPWTDAGVAGASDAAVWARLGVSSPDDVRRWLHAGAVDAVDAVAWKRIGVHIEQAQRQIRQWRRAGVANGRAAAAWTQAAVEWSEVPKWLAQGVAGGQEMILWRALGVEEPKDFATWRAAGVVDGKTARDWVKAGVRCPADLAAWRKAGVRNAKEAADWVWPRFVVSVDEVAAWKAARFNSPKRARARREEGPDPAGVRDAWLGGSFWLRLPGGGTRPVETGPARAAACPTAVLTERYYYAFWHPCRSDTATDVIEIDFDAGGQEVSRCTRPLSLAERRVVTRPLSGEDGAT